MIKIDGTQSTSAPKRTSKKKASGSDDGSAFTNLMDALSAQSESVDAPAHTDGASCASSLSSLDVILSVQGIPEEITRRQRNIQQANLTLDSLEQLQKALLIGAVPLYLLNDIERRMSDMRAEATDPDLIDIIEDIELRAAVELAKFKMQLY